MDGNKGDSQKDFQNVDGDAEGSNVMMMFGFKGRMDSICMDFQASPYDYDPLNRNESCFIFRWKERFSAFCAED